MQGLELLMTKSVAFLAKPEYWIRQYIFNELKQYSLQDVGVSSEQTINPIFPASPNLNFQDIYASLQTETPDPLVILYDKLMRFRTSPFYRIKKEQLILEIYHSNFDIADNVTKIIEQALDREDVAGQSVNTIAASLNDEVPYTVFFHKFRVFKVDESRDLVELNSVNLQFARTRIIVEFDYHVVEPSSYGINTTPNDYT